MENNELDDIFDDAEKSVDAELDGKLAGMPQARILELRKRLQDQGDIKKFDAFIQKAQKATNTNSRRQAYAELFKSLSKKGASVAEDVLKIGKKVFLSIMLVAIATASSSAAGFLARYKLAIPPELIAEVKGHRDVTNSDYLAGYGVDLLWIKKRDENRPVVYLATNHLFNANEKMKGSLGASLGVSTGKAGETINKVFNMITPDHADRLKWIGNLSNFVSIEIGGGYRYLGAADGVKKLHWGYGGKLRIPVDEFFNLFRKKKKE